LGDTNDGLRQLDEYGTTPQPLEVDRMLCEEIDLEHRIGRIPQREDSHPLLLDPLLANASVSEGEWLDGRARPESEAREGLETSDRHVPNCRAVQGVEERLEERHAYTIPALPLRDEITAGRRYERRVMPTHQSLSGASDDELLQRMVKSHAERFGEAFWTFFAAHVAPRLPARPVIIDLGCGPGLLLRDLGERYPAATLYGYDVTPAMIAHGQQVAYAGTKPTLAVHDVATQPLPHADRSVDLLSMSSVLHVLDEPLPVLAEIRRVLAPDGIFLLHDWIRQPLPTYLAWRREVLGESETESRRRGFRLFPMHSKYTPEDWEWLLAEAGFAIAYRTQLRASHLVFVATHVR
jgi:SAM-dependent methyltransferase